MDWNSKKLIRRKSQVAQMRRCPDGGWGWVVVLASVVSLANFSLVQRCFSVFFTYLMSEFDAEFSQVAWLNGLFQAGYGISCPFTPGLLKKFSYRKVTMASSIVSCLSIAVASFQQSLLGVQILAGFVPGLCSGPIMISAFTVTSRYFDARRNLAIQILCGGLTMGGFFYCPTIQFLIDSYTWRGTMLIVAGLYLQSCVSGACMRPIVLEEDFEPKFLKAIQLQEEREHLQNQDLNNNNNNNNICSEEFNSYEGDVIIEKKFAQWKDERNEDNGSIRKASSSSSSSENSSEDKSSLCETQEEEDDCQSRFTKIVQKLNLQVFAMPLFYFYTFSYIFFAAGYFSCLTYLVPYGKSIGLGDIESSTLVSAVMAGEILTRVITGAFLGRVSREGRVLYMACYISLLTVSFTFTYFANDYYLLLVACATIGFFGGAMDGLFSVFMSDAFGMKIYAAIFGYGNILIHLFGMVSTVTVGRLVDAVSDISVVFYVGVGFSVIAGATTFGMRHLFIKKVIRKERKVKLLA